MFTFYFSILAFFYVLHSTQHYFTILNSHQFKTDTCSLSFSSCRHRLSYIGFFFFCRSSPSSPLFHYVLVFTSAELLRTQKELVTTSSDSEQFQALLAGNVTPTQNQNYPVLNCTVLYCTVLQCIALYCTKIYSSTLQCNILQCTVLYMII